MKYDRDPLVSKKEKEYSSKKVEKLEKESIARKEKVYKKTEQYDREIIQAPQKVFKRNQTVEWDLFQWTDTDFVQWANQQSSTMVIAIMAEMKESPKMKPSIQILRSKVNSIPLCSIDSYRKKKRLGERSVDFLKQMKKRYGNNVLRILYVTSES